MDPTTRDATDEAVTDLYFGATVIADDGDLDGHARMLARGVVPGSRIDYLADLARYALQAGRYDDAWCYLERVLELQQKGSAPAPVLAQTLCRLAIAAARRDDPQTAGSLLDRAEALTSAIVPSVLHNRGFLARRSGDLDAAERFYTAALDLKVAACGWHHPAVAATLCAQGQLQLLRDRPLRALRDLAEARHVYETCACAVSTGMAFTLTGMGRAYLRLDMHDHACAALERALAIREALPVPADQLACSRYYLALALWPGRPDEALTLVRAALAEYRRDPCAQPRHVRTLEAWIDHHRN